MPKAKQTPSPNTRTPGTYGSEEIANSELERWPNDYSHRNYLVRFEIPEFTCLCPRSGFPDFAVIVVDYAPDAFVVELKSLKLYINTYRSRAISHESAVNTILEDLLHLLNPRWMRITGEFNVRGNIKTIVTAEHLSDSYQGPRPEYQKPGFQGI